MPSISGFLDSDKGRDIFTILLIILVGLGSFALGRLSVARETAGPVRIETLPQNTAQEASTAHFEAFSVPEEGGQDPMPAPGSVVVSKNGKSYHAPWCPGAKQIADRNKVWYASADEALNAGYKPAGNCKGLE